MLPTNTPNYAVTVESRRIHLSFTILKSLLKWIEKISNMSDNRYPKICCQKIFNLTKPREKISQRYNWALQVESLIRNSGYDKDVDILNVGVLLAEA